MSGCPTDTIVGHLVSYPEGFVHVSAPVYNVVPERGVAAEFGFVDSAGGVHVIDASVAPTPAGYVLRSTTREVPEVPLTEVTVNIYGDPEARDRVTEAAEEGRTVGYTPAPGDTAMFSNPTSCSGEPGVARVHMDSWPDPGAYSPDGTPDFADPNWVGAVFEVPAVTGCGALEGLFKPELEVATESTLADSPTGMNVGLRVPQATGVEGLATPALKGTVITLPEGLVVNPSSANGLQACSEAQIGWEGGTLENFTAAPPACPEASRVGTLELETPALPGEVCKEPGKGLTECPEAGERLKEPIVGSIYVARQLENPFGALLALYIVVDDPRTGVVVKLPAMIEAGGQEGVTGLATGQLRTTIDESPQFPFSVLHTHFFGGDTASLRTPSVCGRYSLTSRLTPWSAPESGPPAEPSSSFEVASAPATGAACPHSEAEELNAPVFEAATETPTAAAYSPLLVRLARADDSQNFSTIDVTLPAGQTGKLAGIQECSEAQIAAAIARSHPGEGALEAESPSCPEASEIGTVTVAAGAGPKPFYATGHAYLAGPYKGAPFSGVFITPVIAGPFDLGVVLVRAGLYINPETAQVTTKSDPLPQSLDGIPVDIRSITVNVNRPSFALNPTSCTPTQITGEETSTQNQTASLNSRYQVGGCDTLQFTPKLTASVAGQASKQGGATLTVKIVSPGVGQANIHKVDLTIPSVLPSRLTTIQKACPERTFDTNPSGCDEGSIIGEGTVHTPLFNNPLHGPAYLVSHGNAAFPDVEYVLQGENVTIVLDGKTDIKNKITYSRFETAPDAPFTTFETTLPSGPHSALTANVPENDNYNLCHQPPIQMPTQLTAQNNLQHTLTTTIEVQNCPTHPSILKHTINNHNHTLTLTLYIPAAGTLKITGKHIHPQTHVSSTRETPTITLHTTPHHPPTTQIHLTLTTNPNNTTTKTTTTTTRTKI